MTEKFANLATSILGAPIGTGNTSLIVASASTFPSTGNFRIVIDSEIMLVTAVSGSTFTVTRGQESTVAASHTSGATVSHVLTSGGFNQKILDNLPGEDISANRPASSQAGELYFNDDDLVLCRDNGSGWNNFGRLFRLKKPPAAGSWTGFNSATALVDTNSGLYLAGSLNSGTNLTGYTMTAPSAPYTIDMAFLMAIPMLGYPNAGFCWGDGTKFVVVAFGVDQPDVVESGLYIPLSWMAINRCNSATSYNSGSNFVNGYGQFPLYGYISGGIFWLQIQDDGTNFLANTSADGQHWFNCFSQSRTNFLTPSEVGFCLDPSGNTAVNWGINLIHWYQH